MTREDTPFIGVNGYEERYRRCRSLWQIRQVTLPGPLAIAF